MASTLPWCRPAIRGGAVHASTHGVAARASRHLGRRNPAARPARRLSWGQERALRAREAAPGVRSSKPVADVTVPAEGSLGPAPIPEVRTSMISRDPMPAPHVHLPLRRLALCLACDECFDIVAERCPACGGATWTSLSRLAEPRVRQLILVAREREHLYEDLKRAFAGNETVRVLRDRRAVERQEPSGPDGAERHQDNRRSAQTIDGLLRAVGWVIVPLGGVSARPATPISSGTR